MWVDKTKEDPYQRLNPVNQQIGAGGGLAQPGGTTSNPSTQNPTPSAEPTQEFATVQDYLGANQQQGEQLGQKVASSLGESLGQEKSTISGAAGQAKSDISSGVTAFDPGLVSSAANDPTKVAGDPGQLDSFLKQWNASYSGPQSFEASSSYAPAITAANEAQAKKAQAETAGGQQQLIQDQFGVYGQGNKGLDQALLQTSSAFPQVQQQAKEFGTIQDYLGQQAGDVNTAAAQAKATTEQTRAQTQGAFTNKLTDFQTGLNEKVAAKRADAQKVADKYKTDLSVAGQVGGDSATLIQDIKDSGATPAEIKTLQDYFQGMQSYKMPGDLGNFANANPNVDVTAANVASPEDYAKSAAYQKLTGVNYGGVLNPADANQPEASVQKPYDVQGLTGYLKGQVSPRDKEMLARNLTANIAGLLNIPADRAEAAGGLSNIMRSPDLAIRVTTPLIQAAQRSGDMTSLKKYYDEAKKDWDQRKNWSTTSGGGATFNPAASNIAGERAFLNSLGDILGKPQV